MFVRDRVAGTTERVSIPPGGGQFPGNSGGSQISADGTRVLFGSLDPMMQPGMPGSVAWFVRDRSTGITRLVSVSPEAGVPIHVELVRLSADGRSVVFNAWRNVPSWRVGTYIHDVETGVTTPAVPGSGWGTGPGFSGRLDIYPIALSTTARYLLCWSSRDLDPTDGVSLYGDMHVWIADRQAATFRLASRTLHGGDWNAYFNSYDREWGWVADDGRIARFTAGGNPMIDWEWDDVSIYERDYDLHRTQVLTLAADGRPASAFGSWPRSCSASDDGRTVAMQQFQAEPSDTPGLWRIYVRRIRGPSASTVCAGDGTSAPCPCGTAGLPGHGCAHANSQDGALLYARGNASFSEDTLSFFAYDTAERPSFLMQSSSTAPGGGVPFMAGVLCLGSPLVRLGPAANGNPSSRFHVFGFALPYWETQPGLAVQGGITGPGTRYYQVWTAPLGTAGCLQSQGTMTNALRVDWRL